jgi:UDP-N-acetylmuramoylalanine--D-glutamate ligase
MSTDQQRPAWLDAPATDVPWRELRVLVCGLGISGTAAVEVLLHAGATVEVVDAATGDTAQSRAAALTARGAVVRLGDADRDIGRPDLVVTSPGWAPDNPVLRRAASAGVPIWGEVELAWRFTPPTTRWLAVTGTNGKTTTTEMLASMLATAQLRSTAAGNIGTALLDAVRAEPPYDLLAVELSSFQLHWSSSVHPVAAALLNIAPDHLDWHGSLAAYAADKAAVFARMGADDVAVGNADDPQVRALLAAAPAGRKVEFTLAAPGTGQLGVEDGWLVDRAFGLDGLLPVARMRGVIGPHNVANALAALGVALGAGVDKAACLAALTHFAPGAHRLATVLVRGGVRYVDDSKATNPHAAAQALASFDRVVWIAGGLNKGLEFDELVAGARDRLVATVLIGSCADQIAAALARHAPEVPVRYADSMHTAVEAAAGVARDGDTVLLAPAAASMDMFRDYRERGDAFRVAAEAITGRKDDSAG